MALLTLSLGSAWADVDSTTWSTNNAQPALGSITSNSITTNITLNYGAYLNGGQQFPANWTSIAGTLGSITPSVGMAIGYTKGSAVTQSISFSQSVTNPYLMFNYVDLMAFDFSSVGASNVSLIHSNGIGISLSNGIITVSSNSSSGGAASDGFVVKLIGTFTSLNFTTSLSNNAANTNDSSGFAIAVDAPLSTISGTMSGLANGQNAVLQNNGTNNLTVSSNGSFTFTTPINRNTNYAVTVLTQPNGQTCAVQNGSGTATGNVTNVAVNCQGVPTVTAINPASGPTGGGTTATVTGTNFVIGATTVTVGGNTCASPNVTSTTSLTCTLPAGTTGNASVVATTAAGSNGANTLYTYVAAVAGNNGVNTVPTLSEWALLALSGLVALAAGLQLRRRLSH